MVPRSSPGEAFGLLFRPYLILMIFQWYYLLPRSFLLVLGCDGEILGYCRLAYDHTTPDFIAFFPTGESTDPCWYFLSGSAPLFCWSPRYSVCCVDSY